MTIEKLRELAANFLEQDVNRVTADNAVSQDLIGLRFYDNPIFGIADANDPLFQTLREPGIMGPGVLLPKDVLPSAKRVISWFLPFTKEVRSANGESMSEPSDSWRQARMEGQDANIAMGKPYAGHWKQKGPSPFRYQPAVTLKCWLLFAATGRNAM